MKNCYFRKGSIILSAILLFVFLTYGYGENIEQNGLMTNDAVKNNIALDDSKTTDDSKSEDNSKRYIRNGLLIGEVPVILFFGAKAWNWEGDHSFYSEKEGWFGKDTDYGGQDKAGHFFAHYMLQRSMYSVFDWTEDGSSTKWIYSLGSSLTCGFLIEIGDGFSSKYGFSYEDLVMDYSGILVGAMLDRFPVLGGFIGISGNWSPTDAYLDRFSSNSMFTDSLEFVDDYSGWTFYVNFKLAGFQNLGFDVPLALRLLQVDIGYYTRGYSNYDKNEYASPHERDICIGISINSAQLIAETWGKPSNSAGYNVTHKFFEYYHVPFDVSHSYKL